MLKKEKLPKIISVFPLSNFIIFPETSVPLNIFEPRYLEMINDCMKKDKMIGMVQPKKNKDNSIPDLHQIGCLGKIISFNETDDKRFIISLSGLIRFKIKKELENENLYRKFHVDYSDFISDLEEKKEEKINYDKNNLLIKIKLFFERINYSVEFNELEKLNFDQLISTVCMISPFSVEEKQKLIEAIKIEEKMRLLDEIVSFNIFDLEDNKTIQ